MINVVPESGENDVYASDDATSGLQGTTLGGDLLGNDNDPEGDNLTSAIPVGLTATDTAGVIVTYTTPSGGIVAIDTTTGVYTYTPDANFVGTETFTYSVCDDGSPVACDTATVVLTLLPGESLTDYSENVLYGDAWHVNFEDTDGDNIPNDADAVWLGTIVTYENAIKSDDDTDGLSISDEALLAGDNSEWVVTMNANTAGTEVYYGLWIDWDQNGAFDSFYAGSGTAQSPVNDTLIVPIPVSLIDQDEVNVRLRASDTPITQADSEGMIMNGEVEDFVIQGSTLLPLVDISDPVFIDQSLDAIQLYPNPVDNVFFVDITSSKATNAQVKVIATTGALVENTEVLLQRGKQTLTFEASNYAVGNYVVQVVLNGKILTEKLFVK